MALRNTSPIRWAIPYLVFSALIPIAAYTVFAFKPLYTIVGQSEYLAFHTSVEIFSSIVGFAIAYVSYSGFSRTGSRTILILGTAFLVQAVIDPIHAFVFPGVTNPFIQSGTNQAIDLWLVARLSGAFLLLLSAALPETEVKKGRRTSILTLSCLCVILLATISTYAVRDFMNALPPMFIAGKGLTPLKIGLEDLVALGLFATALLYLKSFMRTGNRTLFMFTIGIVIFAFSEVGFMLYTNPYDIYNLLGHVFKLAAFIFFLIGLLIAK